MCGKRKTACKSLTKWTLVLHGGCLDDVVFSRDELKSGPRSVCVLIISKVSTLVLSLKRHLPDLSNLIGQRGFLQSRQWKTKESMHILFILRGRCRAAKMGNGSHGSFLYGHPLHIFKKKSLTVSQIHCICSSNGDFKEETADLEQRFLKRLYRLYRPLKT